jgi:hypothetical protein
MAPSQYPFIADGVHGRLPMNMYPTPDDVRGVLLESDPGLLAKIVLTDSTEIRGMYSWGDFRYVVAKRGSQSVLWKISDSHTAVELGTILTSSSGPVYMANNPTQLSIVEGAQHVFTPSTGLMVQDVGLDFLGASIVRYQDGYGLYIVPDSNRWFFGGLFDFLVHDSLDFYDKQSKPDNLVSTLSFMKELYLFGVESTELWYNAGGDNSSAASPTFAINTGGVIEHGCGAAASPSDLCGEAPIWLTSRGQLRKASGYSSQVVSNQMFDRATAIMTTYADAIGFSYRLNGHVFYQITFPTADQTWVFDNNTGLLHERQSWKSGSGYGRHRANCYCLHKGKHYVGDFENGTIYQMDSGYYSDNGEEIVRTAHMKEVDGGRQRIFFPSMQIVAEAGVGSSVLDPTIALQFSGDGGHVWSSELYATVGKVGEYTKRALWNRLGSGYRRMYKITMTDSVLWRILGVDVGGNQ